MKYEYKRFQAYLGKDDARDVEIFRNHISIRLARATYKDNAVEKVSDGDLLKYLINFYKTHEKKPHEHLGAH